MPRVCGLCRTVDFEATEDRTAFCAACTAAMCPEPIHRCQRCGAEVGLYTNTETGCHHCRDHDIRFDSVTCLGMYDSELKQAVLSAKWSFSAVRLNSLARLLATRRKAELDSLRVDCIVPIPQHWRQRLWRQFNPAWLIARELSQSLHVPCDLGLLSRSRRTRPQKRVALHLRYENQRDAFRLQGADSVRGQRILLIDDVVTSGATCSEAARLFRKAGAKACHVAALARVLDRSA